MRFEWDRGKSRSNQSKHAISFEEAALVFADPLRLSVQDRIDNGEERWQTIGSVGGLVVVLVAHTLVEDDEDGEQVEVIRIISARRANRNER